jgi:hypothetical protein
MSKPNSSSPLLTPAQLQSDLTYLSSNPNILDALLSDSHVPSLPSATSTSSQDLETLLSSYSPATSTPAESVILSQSFVNLTRAGILKVVQEEEGGVIGQMGSRLDEIREQTEGLERGFEGVEI